MRLWLVSAFRRPGKQKTPPPSGSGVKIRVNESAPDCHAAQQQRIKQQSSIQITIHEVIISRLEGGGQIDSLQTRQPDKARYFSFHTSEDLPAAVLP